MSHRRRYPAFLGCEESELPVDHKSHLSSILGAPVGQVMILGEVPDRVVRVQLGCVWGKAPCDDGRAVPLKEPLGLPALVDTCVVPYDEELPVLQFLEELPEEVDYVLAGQVMIMRAEEELPIELDGRDERDLLPPLLARPQLGP